MRTSARGGILNLRTSVTAHVTGGRATVCVACPAIFARGRGGGVRAPPPVVGAIVAAKEAAPASTWPSQNSKKEVNFDPQLVPVEGMDLLGRGSSTMEREVGPGEDAMRSQACVCVCDLVDVASSQLSPRRRP